MLFVLTVASISSGALAQASDAQRSDAESATAEQSAEALVAQMSLAEKASLMAQTMAPGPRLGVGPYQLWNEALHGVTSDLNTTQFPQVIGLAASFDDGLVNRVAIAISSEVRAVHAIKKTEGDTITQGSGLNIWAPNINIFRDPRWGRGQ